MRDHRDVMVALARKHGWRRGVELGLGSGMLFRRLLAEGIEMIGVDIGARADRRRLQEEIAREYAGQCRVLWLSTAEAAGRVEDGWADFVFIDAAHSYPAVKSDIALWRPKVRTGGWFGGHDYHSSHGGVIRAVDEAFPGRVEILPHWVWAVEPC